MRSRRPVAVDVAHHGGFGVTTLGITARDIFCTNDHEATVVPELFLSGFDDLVSVDLSQLLRRMTSIDHQLLYGCPNVTAIDLLTPSRASWSSWDLVKVGDGCLAYLGSLTELDLGAFSRVTTIGNKFAFHCSALTLADLSGLTSVRTIADCFLGQTRLPTVDFSSMTNLLSIDDHFMHYCYFLTNANLNGLSNLTSIGDGFMSGCENLVAIDCRSVSPRSAITFLPVAAG